jgi:DNA-binding NtrC family response regulator
MAILSAGTTIDAVFCDVNLGPDMDGLAFSQWLAKYYPKLPIILTSAEPSVAGLVMETPPLRFVVKPYVLHDIEQQLNNLLDAK